MTSPSPVENKAQTANPEAVVVEDDDLCTEDLRLLAEADEEQRGVEELPPTWASEHSVSHEKSNREAGGPAVQSAVEVAAAAARAATAPGRGGEGGGRGDGGWEGHEPFAAAIAKSFEAAEKALSDSHEAALRFIAHCMQEARHSEPLGSWTPRPPAGFAAAPPRSPAMSQAMGPSTSGRLVIPSPCMAGPPAAGLPPPRSPRPKVTWSSEVAAPQFEPVAKPTRPPKDEEPVMPPGSAPSLPGALEVRVEEVQSLSRSNSFARQQASSRAVLEVASAQVSRRPSGAISLNPSERSEKSGEKREPNRGPSKASSESEKSLTNHHQLLEVWGKQPVAKKRKKALDKKFGKMSRSCTSDSLMSMDAEVERGLMCAWIPVIDPNSTTRASWDIASIFLVIYDMVMIPLQLFDIPDTLPMDVLGWTTRMFWTFDVFVSFFTGILKRDGSVEVRPWRIARQYLKTWFLIDFMIVGVDWIEVLWNEGSFLGFARAGKASRTFRIIRLVRLIRLARLRTVFRSFMERLKSEQLVVIAGIISIMLVIVSMSHIMGCVWYGIATATDRPDTWLKVHGFDDKSIAMKYFTALHWSLLQFAGGSDEIVPQNTGERIYAVVVFLIAFIMAAVFVGRLTSSMTQLHMLSRKDLEKFQVLKRYLQKNEISAVLSMRVMHNAQHALLETQRFMEESRVELLSIISEPLRVELHFELYSPVFAVHPFFRCFIDACPQVMKKVCHKATSQLLASPGDVLFMAGEVPSPPRMFIICSGELSYHFVSGAVAYVQAGQWLSEAVLWASWTHQGMLKAASDCRLVVLDAAIFLHLVETFDHDFDVRKYARTFVSCMNSGAIEPSDLPFSEDAEEITEVISSLQTIREVQTTVGESNSPKLLRRSSSLSVASSAGSSTVLGEDSPRKSVLMVTPGGGEKKIWW